MGIWEVKYTVIVVPVKVFWQQLMNHLNLIVSRHARKATEMEPRHILEATWSLCEPVPSWVILVKLIQQVLTCQVPGSREVRPPLRLGSWSGLFLCLASVRPLTTEPVYFRSLKGHGGQERSGEPREMGGVPNSADRLDLKKKKNTPGKASPAITAPSQRSLLNINFENPGRRCFQQPNQENRRQKKRRDFSIIYSLKTKTETSTSVSISCVEGAC